MTNPMTPTDAELLRLIVAGNEPAFTALYRRHQGFVYRFALMMSGAADLAEEVTQEVFLALIRDANRYDPERGAFTAYLCGMARNQVLRVLARERPFVPLVHESGESEAAPLIQLIAREDQFSDCTRNEISRLVRQAVLALPAHYREVVVLCDFQELSHAEAALALDCPAGTVNSRLRRGHALLLKKLCLMDGSDSAAAKTQRTTCFA
jgi:RNA polymerase sigma-70 factor, ECF subfamily